jgi:hypothetical protein
MELWTHASRRPELRRRVAEQHERLRALIAHAVAASPCYRELLGLDAATGKVPLRELPAVGGGQVAVHPFRLQAPFSELLEVRQLRDAGAVPPPIEITPGGLAEIERDPVRGPGSSWSGARSRAEPAHGRSDGLHLRVTTLTILPGTWITLATRSSSTSRATGASASAASLTSSSPAS